MLQDKITIIPTSISMLINKSFSYKKKTKSATKKNCDIQFNRLQFRNARKQFFKPFTHFDVDAQWGFHMEDLMIKNIKQKT